jgi:NADH-quinone oxidoreductase subunit G
MINFKINGQSVVAQKGETILDVARQNDIYIPTMCYLEKTSSIGSCRLCVVEVKDVDGLVLSCQTPPTEGIEVNTNSDELFNHRQNIMKLYNVNHPLECGVCDKSGECDLQNKTLEFGVDSQEFSAKDQARKIQDWGMIQYDPNLCILCEKCVHTCNEVIGDDAIDLYFGGYSSSVIPKNSETLECTNCGECIAVCPVGALVSSDFKYTSNAWELQKIPATCVHCSAGCELNYEVKETGTFSQNSDKIYRVTNDYENTTLCGAGRFGFDFANNLQNSQNKFSLTDVADKIKNSDAILFNSQITNEEALILQRIKQKLNLKLINNEAFAFQKFLKAFEATSNSNFYNAQIEDVIDSDLIMVIGSAISTDNPQVRYALTQAHKKNRAFISYLHPVYDPLLQNTVRQFVNYEVGTEEGVIAMLTKTLLSDSGEFEISYELDKFLNSLDDGYLSAESNVGEEEFEVLAKKLKRSSQTSLVVGSDIFYHERAENIAKFLGMIQKYSDINILFVPENINTLGVSLICDLDDSKELDLDKLKTVGYNCNADFVISALDSEKTDFGVPALNQQEGTFVNIDKKVIKTNVAVEFKNSENNLNNIANLILTHEKENTIDYTQDLVFNTENIKFDDIKNYLELEVIENLEFNAKNIEEVKKAEAERECELLDEVEDLPTFDGTVIYNQNPVLQFNQFTAVSEQINTSAVLLASEQFAKMLKLSDDQKIRVETDNFSLERVFKIDTNLKGVIALNPTFDAGLSSCELFSNYRFSKAKITKI